MTEDEVKSLPVFTDGLVCISVWQLDLEEIEMIKKTGQIRLHVMSGHSQPPVLLEVVEPNEDAS
jgi:hypothetical protein